jgi:hypothetical protein
MAGTYDNNMSGIISKNDRKEKETHPDYKGSCEIDNKEFWISGWIKERKDGTGKFLSLSFNPKDQQQSFSSASSASLGDEDAPF